MVTSARFRMQVHLRLIIGTKQDGGLLPFGEHDLLLSSSGEFPPLTTYLTASAGWNAILYLVVKLDVEHQYIVAEYVWNDDSECWRAV